MRPVILTNAFRRPQATRTSTGITVDAAVDVYACIEDLIKVITGPLDALPLLLPVISDEATVAALLDHVDGILLPGAVSNIDPARYAVDALPGQLFDPVHDAVDFFLVGQARRRGLPFFGICRAMQAMNIVFDGSLNQKLAATAIDHKCSYPCDGTSDALEYMHPINLTPGGYLEGIFGPTALMVNSMHEQAIERLGSGLKIEAVSPDGVIEAISWTDGPGFFLGVQWHPEAMPAHPVSAALFANFKQAVQARFERRS